MNFSNEPLPAPILRALKAINFTNATPIQEAAIPLALQGKDIIGCAQTGTGKTAAFSIPFVTQCFLDPDAKVLVLAPTRELAAQIHQVVMDLTRYTSNIRSCLIVGGASMHRQFVGLKKKPSIIIATPGRLMDHLRRRSCDLSQTSCLVLDEADRMLDMGFGPQIEEIIRGLPSERQTMMFSATLPPKIKKLAESLLNSPAQVSVGTWDKPAEKVEQSHIRLAGHEKSGRLLQELTTQKHKTLVFTRTKRGADKLNKFLEKNGIESACIHGDRSQSQRNKAISDFRTGKRRVMVATDVASRGLDVDQIKLVINYDLPKTSEDYIHRIGRTARAGETGAAVSFVTDDEVALWNSFNGTPAPNSKRRKAKRFQPNFRFKRSGFKNFRNFKEKRNEK